VLSRQIESDGSIDTVPLELAELVVEIGSTAIRLVVRDAHFQVCCVFTLRRQQVLIFVQHRNLKSRVDVLL